MKIGLVLLGLLFGTAGQLHSEEYLIQQTFDLGTHPIYQAFFNPDNRLILSLAKKHKVEIWSAKTGKRIKSFATNEHQAISMISHPTEATLITGGKDHTIRIWDPQHGTSTAVLRGHIGKVNTMVINRTGNRLISGGADGGVIIWDVPQLIAKVMLTDAHEGPVNSVALHPKEKIFASAGRDRKIYFWDASTGQKIAALQGHKKDISQIIFHPQGSLIISSSHDHTIKVWDWKKEKPLRTFKGHTDAVTSVDLHPNGAQLMSGSLDKTIRLWDFSTQEELSQLPLVDYPVIGVQFDTTGHRVVAGFKKRSIHTWEMGESTFLDSFEAHRLAVSTLEFVDNQQLLSTSLDKTMKVWKVGTDEKPVAHATRNHRILDTQMDPETQHLITAGADSSIGVWDLDKGERLKALKPERGKVNSIDFHPTDPVFASAGSNRKWLLWKTDQNKPILSIDGHKSQINVIKMFPNGKYLATGSQDRTIQVWGYPDGNLVDTLKGHRKAVLDIDFHPQGHLMVSASSDQTIRLWDINERGKGTHRKTLKGHTFVVNHVMFSKDGQSIISGSKDRTTRLWDVNSGNPIRILNGEESPVSSLALSPNGELIAVGTIKGKISILEYPLVISDDPDQNRNLSQNNTITDTDTATAPEGDLEVDKLSLEEVGADLNLNIYDFETVADPSEQSLELQKDLNQLLKRKQFCADQSQIEDKAFSILILQPQDRAAYYALLKLAIMQVDLNLLFLVVEIGKNSTYLHEIYDYALPIEVSNEFDYWEKEVFDQSYTRYGQPTKLTITDCDGKRHPIDNVDFIGTLGVPKELADVARTIPEFMVLRNFQGQDNESFKNRLLAIIKQGYVPIRAATEPEKEEAAKILFSEVETGTLFLNLEELQLWGSPQKIPFEVRESSGDWQSYHTDLDKKKQLTLPIGEYYLKINDRIEQAFLIQKSEEMTIKVKNELVF